MMVAYLSCTSVFLQLEKIQSLVVACEKSLKLVSEQLSEVYVESCFISVS